MKKLLITSLFTLFFLITASPTNAQLQGTCGMAPTSDETLVCPTECSLSALYSPELDYHQYTCGTFSLSCGQTFTSEESFNITCSCGSGIQAISAQRYCCGWESNGQCSPRIPDNKPPIDFDQIEEPIEDPDPVADPGLNPLLPPTDETFDELNPLKVFGNEDSAKLTTPAGVINRLASFAFPLAFVILLVMLIWAGFEMVSGATNKKSQDAGKQRATAAVVGLLLLFVSFWIIRVLEIVTGAKIF